jgi:excisionase family DNA binding protein
MTTQANEQLTRILQAFPEVRSDIDRLVEERVRARLDQESDRGRLLMGMSEAAKYLNVSRATLWRICRSKRLARVEILPKSFRVRRADLEALAAGKRGAP